MHPAVSRKSNSATKSEILGVGDEFPCRECLAAALSCTTRTRFYIRTTAAAPECVRVCSVCGGNFMAEPLLNRHRNRTCHLQQKQLQTVPDFGNARACMHANFDRNMRRDKSKRTNNKAFLGKNLPNLECLQHFGARASRENNGPVRRQVFLKHLRQFFALLVFVTSPNPHKSATQKTWKSDQILGRVSHKILLRH
jgi:hypothetical protein